MDLLLPFVIYTVSLGSVAFIVWRFYRWGRKHWCPHCHWFNAEVRHVRERVPGAQEWSHVRLCHSEKFCGCGFERALSPLYRRKFSANELAAGERQKDVLNV